MRKKSSQNDLFLFLILLIFSLVIFYFSGEVFLKKTRAFFERPVLVLQEAGLGVRQKILAQFLIFSNWRQNYQEKILLEQKLRSLIVEKGELSVCLEENEAMKRLLGAPLLPSWYFIPAKVVGLGKGLKINVGQKAGVEKEMLVVSQNLLVGKIVSVEEHSSMVILPTDPSLKMPVIVRSLQGSGIKARGILSGFAGSQMVLAEVLKSEAIGEGDLVFTNDDLLIGEIIKIEEGKEKVFKKAWVVSLLDWQKLRHVFVIKNR